MSVSTNDHSISANKIVEIEFSHILSSAKKMGWERGGGGGSSLKDWEISGNVISRVSYSKERGDRGEGKRKIFVDMVKMNKS